MVPGKSRGQDTVYTDGGQGRVQRSTREEAGTLALVQGRRKDPEARQLKPKVSSQRAMRENWGQDLKQDLKQVSSLCRQPKDPPN